MAIFIFKQQEQNQKLPLYPAAMGFNASPILHGSPMDATTLLSPEDAQQLIDDLWNAGLRPSDEACGLEPFKPEDNTEGIEHLKATGPIQLWHPEKTLIDDLLRAKDAHIADLQAVLQACLHKLQ